MIKDYKVRVPLIYIRNRGTHEQWSLLGANHNDVLQVIGNGRAIIYSNTQTCESSECGYEIHGNEEIVDALGTTEFRIQMVPWPEAVKIFKRLGKSYRRFYKLFKVHTTGRC